MKNSTVDDSIISGSLIHSKYRCTRYNVSKMFMKMMLFKIIKVLI